MATTITHPSCGKSWLQRGNKTGHCSKCHHTFFGIGAFDRHQTHTEDGKVICHDPASGARGPWYLDEDDQWRHGKPMTAEQKAELKAKFAANRLAQVVHLSPAATAVEVEDEALQAA